ncbi:MAG: hypothetical protein ACLTKU_08810, partial [Faecalibacterium prausnitzii]
VTSKRFPEASASGIFCFALSPAGGKACDCSKHPYKTLLLLWTFEQLELFSLSTFIPSCSR